MGAIVHCEKALRNDKHSFLVRQGFDGADHGLFCYSVEGASGYREEQHFRIVIQHTDVANALALAV